MLILALDRPAASDIPIVVAHVTAPPSLISPALPKEIL
jgi:hypothetical protein